ncbi:hypothetical protein [Streptomyces sp. SCL15-4]|uniref:hypothetical protein n=1 Tax=Streptomyces sp. SCL15-4 TaxID=2967221 RepID=UPI0029676875|nr:hypothetical protein [Streptomyces sp. SCL15-4]
MRDQPTGPTWRDDPDALDQLCDLGADALYEPAERQPRDLRGQGLTAVQLQRIRTITPDRRYL